MNEKKSVPLWRFFPNIVTLLSVCSGLTAIKYTFNYKWEMAVIFIIMSAILDGMDGRIARMLDSSTDFGAELDSLADLVNFGVAPGLLIYFYSLKNIKVVGWSLVMAFVICLAIRLARFNVESLQDINSDLEYRRNFFVGVPAPIGALLVIMPIILSFSIEEFSIMYNIFENQYFIAVYTLIISTLIVSRIPTFSGKNIRITSNMEPITTFIIGIIIVLLITKPWIVLPLLGILYIVTIPISTIWYYHLKNTEK